MRTIICLPFIISIMHFSAPLSSGSTPSYDDYYENYDEREDYQVYNDKVKKIFSIIIYLNHLRTVCPGNDGTIKRFLYSS